MQVNNNPRFLLFAAYGTQQFGKNPFTYALGIETILGNSFFSSQ